MARDISISFVLNAALQGGFKSAFATAEGAARSVAAAVREMEKSPTGRLGATMASQRQKIQTVAASMREANSVLATLRQQADAAGGASVVLSRQISLQEAEVRKLTSAYNRTISAYKNTVAEAATVGGSVEKLTGDYKKLTGEIERHKRVAASLHANRATGEALASQRADLQGRLLSTTATAMSVALPVKLAISAEDTFADLRKVMDAPEAEMQKVFPRKGDAAALSPAIAGQDRRCADAQAMSARTGKSFEDVVAIMTAPPLAAMLLYGGGVPFTGTAAAQAGLGKTREELLGVADQAVKMSIAWGVSADEAGKSLASWQAAMGLTSDEAAKMGDVINALSNEMNAEAGDINAIFTRMGAMMKSAGMEVQDIAALATAFKAAGAQVEVAGTAMKNFKKVLTAPPLAAMLPYGGGVPLAGTAPPLAAMLPYGGGVPLAGTAGSAGLTDERISLMKFIKIDPDELQKEFYRDSKTAITRVLEALKNNVRAEELDSVASKLFGEESIAAISPLISQLDLLKQAQQIANSEVRGSVDEEYQNRMKTTATAIDQMTQSVKNLGVNVGATLLPAVGAVSRGISAFASGVSGIVQRFPTLTSVVSIAGAGIAAFAAGSLALGLVINTIRSSINSVSGAFLRLTASQLTATATTGGFTIASWASAAATKAAGIGARFFAGGLRSILMATGIGAALVGIGYGLNLLIENWEGLLEVATTAWNWITAKWGSLVTFFGSLASGIFAVFSDFGKEVWAIFGDTGKAIISAFSELGSDLAAIFAPAWDFICATCAGARDSVIAIWQGAISVFSAIGQKITGVFYSIGSAIKGAFSWAADTAVAIFDGFITAVQWYGQALITFWTGIGNGIIAVFQFVGNGIIAAWDMATNTLSTIFGGAADSIISIWSYIGDFFGAIGAEIVAIFGPAWDEISSFATWAYESVSAVWNSAVGFFAGIVDSIWSKFTAFFDWLADKFSWVLSTINAVGSFLGKIGSAIGGAIDKITGSTAKAAGGIATAFGEAAKESSKAGGSPEREALKTGTQPEKPLAATATPGLLRPNSDNRPSLSAFLDEQAAAKKAAKKSGRGGSSGRSGARSGAGSAAATKSGGPVTVVSLDGNNSQIKTAYYAAGEFGKSGTSPVATQGAPIATTAKTSPLGTALAARPIGPQTPTLPKKSASQNPAAITIDLTQNFDLITENAEAAKKILAQIKPDMEALIRNALAKINSDRSRTLYAR